MTEREGGQWNVAVKNKAVHVERVSEDGEQLFDDVLDPDEARQLGELLTKHAGKVGESEQSDSDESEDDEDSDESKESGDETDEDQSDDEDSEEKSGQTD